MLDRAAEALHVSVVLPCYNEETSIELELERIVAGLTAAGLDFEVIVVDDASTDATRALATSASRRLDGIRVLGSSMNRGAGASRKRGTIEARGQIVVWTDCDLTYPNDRIADLAHLLDERPGLDQVIGDRTADLRDDPQRARWAVKRAIGRYLTHRVGTPVGDYNSGMRAFRREGADEALALLPAGFSCATTMTLAYLLRRRGVAFIPVATSPRAGRSKYRPIVDTYRLLRQAHRVIRAMRRTISPAPALPQPTTPTP